MSGGERDAGTGLGAGRKRRRWLTVAGIAVAVVTYVIVVLLYAASGRVEEVEAGDQQASDESAVLVEITPNAINGPNERLSLDVVVEAPESLIAENGVQLEKALSVVVYPADDTAITLDAGGIPRATRTIAVNAEGSAENWPLDRYTTQVAFLAFSGAGGDYENVPIRIDWKGYLSGWNFHAVAGELPLEDGALVQSDGSVLPVPFLAIEASRSGATLAFGTVLLALLVTMPVLVFIVAVNAYTGRRKVEATLTSWMGAMLFATIPLRTFLPGSPPIGSWIDFLIVLWVIVALVTGLGIYVAAWYRWGSPADAVTAAGRDAVAPPDSPRAPEP
ncbi:DUF4436 domain-containing protein [Herbiconiux moechotypicola]|uniref:DUF4436 domain-containing protein n=1 Tax=Herbiconiux moechotypicola TaxID=637393 RepID=A0ABP5QMY0_9MICO|nr:DUF4436 domain-containing protein [Herbiconiux moechotypicola]MCS5730651.1 DUF4436 domain-containing protein [Herbiconiux moechotypicola]